MIATANMKHHPFYPENSVNSVSAQIFLSLYKSSVFHKKIAAGKHTRMRNVPQKCYDFVLLVSIFRRDELLITAKVLLSLVQGHCVVPVVFESNTPSPGDKIFTQARPSEPGVCIGNCWRLTSWRAGPTNAFVWRVAGICIAFCPLTPFTQNFGCVKEGKVNSNFGQVVRRWTSPK